MICYVYVLYTRTDLERDSDTWTSLDPSAAKTFGTHERLTHITSVIIFFCHTITLHQPISTGLFHVPPPRPEINANLVYE